MLWLAANHKFGLVKYLGAGLDREAWLTRCGRVFKLPKRGDHSDTQTYREAVCLKEGRTGYGAPVPQGELVFILGVPCIIMEYVEVQDDVLGRLWAEHNRLPHPHKEAFDRPDREVAKALKKAGVVSHDWLQCGLTASGKWVLYDLGFESSEQQGEALQLAACQ